MTRRLHNRDAEASVLGAIMLKGDEALDRVELHPEDFFDLKTREVFSAMLRLRDKSAPVGDPECVAEELGDMLEPCGGRAYLCELLYGTVTADNVDFYAALVRKAAVTRRAITAINDVLAGDDEGDDLLARIGEMTAGLATSVADPSVTMRDAMRGVWEQTVKAMDEGRSGGGLPTGFHDIDQILNGLMLRVVHILAGRPGAGKSALARSIADNVNAAGDGVHVFTPEDSWVTYAMRGLSDHARVDLERIVGCKLQRGDLEPIMRARDHLAARTGWRIDDTSGISSRDISLRVRKHKRENKTKLVVVDYVQLMREPQAPAYNPMAHINLALTGLSQLAKAEDVAVLLLSQLSRKCEERPDKRPLLSDLRESGELEQAAYSVTFVYRDEMYHEDTEDRGISEAIVRKNKNGKTGTARLAWDGPTATHRTLYEREVPQW